MPHARSGRLIPEALPDFRNLGVIARILLCVNGAAMLAAVLRADTFKGVLEETLNIALFVEPVLCAVTASLWLLQPVLGRLAYWRGLPLVAIIVLVFTVVVQWLVAGIGGDASHNYLRGCALALLTTALLASYFYLRQLAFSPVLAEARLQALQARIRPHFLYNALNAVLAMMRSDPRRAETALEDLAELYRTLMADNKRLIPLSKEIEITRQYLNLEQLRLGDRLIVSWQIDKAPMDALVPPLLLQPLVENGVYHGVEPCEGAGTIEIFIARTRDRLEVRLRNPYHSDQ
ncbi:MAG TPA: sensor histidine kinase, partial [Burkholderiales bacterium]|nr:sensor histidine kinase [Burkholderiales bacterium]